MKIKRIKFQNYTVFEDQQMEFSPGINLYVNIPIKKSSC